MANYIIRSAKSGDDWTSGDLVAYNIKTQMQSALDFFGYVPSTMPNTLEPAFVDAGFPADESLSDDTYRLVQYMDFATKAHRGKESFVGDFTKELLRVLGFEKRGTVLRQNFSIPLTICGNTECVAQTDVFLNHGTSTILLVIQECKMATCHEAQIVAEAIAAFQYNNEARDSLNMEPLETMIIPAITMIGTRPFFYKIPVTQQLSDAVVCGQHPTSQTVVTRCTFVPPSGRVYEGMEVPKTRQEILKYFTAFKNMAEQSWSQFI